MTDQAETRLNSPKPNFSHDVLKLVSAPVFTQAVGIIVIPLITRLYAPEAFGLMALFISIFAPIEAFTTMKYSTSIMLPESDEEGAAMFGVSLVFAALAGGLTALGIMFGQNAILNWLKAPELRPYLWFVPISIFLSGLYMSLRYWNMRNGRFAHLAIGSIFSYISNNGFVLVAGFLGYTTAISLILGTFLSGIVMVTVLSWRVLRQHKNLLKSSIRWAAMVAGAKRYRKFPMYGVPTEFASRLASQTPIYLMSYYFSQSIIGYYALSVRLLRMPFSLIGNSIGEVYFQRASQGKHVNDLLLEKIFDRLVLFGLLPFSLLGLVGADLFELVLGHRWAESGVYAQIFSFQMFIMFVTGPAGYLTLIFEKQEFGLFLKLAEVLIIVGSISLGGFYKSVYLSFILLSFLTGLLHACYGFYFMKLGGIKSSMLLRTLGKYLFFSSPVIFAVAMSKWYFDLTEIWIILASMMASGIFYFIILRRDEESKFLAMSILTKLKFSKN